VADTIEFEASTEREAVEKASRAVGVDADTLDYTVVDEGADGVFGLGARPVKIRVRPPEGAPGPEDEETAEPESGEAENAEAEVTRRRGPAPEKAAQAGEVVREVLDRMAVPAQVEVRDEDEEIVVVIREAEEGATRVAEVFGSGRPPPIPALQFLLNKIVNRFPEDRKHVALEVPGVPKRERKREPRAEVPAPAADAPMPTIEEVRAEVDPELDLGLVEVGFELAERARSLGKVISVYPMLPGDRRAIHQTVMRIPGAQTLSEGEGLYRKMHVLPEALAKGSNSGSGRRRRRRRRGSGKGASSAPA
jgi:predicted RNA-binding protein Jag